MFILSNRIYLPDGKFHTGTLELQGEKIANFFPLSFVTEKEKAEYSKTGDLVLFCPDSYIVPGFIDTHLHGCAGHDFSDGTGLPKIAAFLLQNGVTSFCPATMTLPLEQIILCLQAAHDFPSNVMSENFSPGDIIPRGGVPKTNLSSHNFPVVPSPGDDTPLADLLGIYLEGPFFSKEKKGAQNEEFLRLPEISFLESIPQHLLSDIRILSLAPELPGAISMIEQCRKRFPAMSLSLGHTMANASDISFAFQAGARRITHLYNAMAHPDAMITAVKNTEGAYAELITDGYHNSPERILSAYKILGKEKIILISDSMRATGLGDGTYDLGGQTVDVHGKLATLPDGAKAGSVSTLLECFQKAVSVGIPLEDALFFVTSNPAKALHQERFIGSLSAGTNADILILSEDLSLQSVIKKGRQYSL